MIQKKQLPQAIKFSFYFYSMNASFTGKINLCWECQERKKYITFYKKYELSNMHIMQG